MLSDAICRTLASSISVATTRAPAAAKARAVSRPMPCPAAVTKAVLSARVPGIANSGYELSIVSGRPVGWLAFLQHRTTKPGDGGKVAAWTACFLPCRAHLLQRSSAALYIGNVVDPSGAKLRGQLARPRAGRRDEQRDRVVRVDQPEL